MKLDRVKAKVESDPTAVDRQRQLRNWLQEMQGEDRIRAAGDPAHAARLRLQEIQAEFQGDEPLQQ